MTEALLDLNIICAATILFFGAFRRTAYLEFPFLAALTFACWYLPQAITVVSHADVPETGLRSLLVMSLLSLLMTAAGWQVGSRVGAGRAEADAGRPLDLDVESLVLPVAILTCFAIGLELLIRQQPDEVRAGAWSGPITILAFFRTAGKPALVASLLMVLHRRTPSTVMLAFFNLALAFPSVFIAYRRIDTIDLAFAVLAALWLIRRVALPRLAIVAIGVAGFFFVHAVGELRALGGAYTLDENGEISSRLPTWDEISRVDWFASNPLAGGEVFEVENAATYMALADANRLTLGGQAWNRMVAAYVPGQIIGLENKQALTIGVSLQELAFSELGYDWHVGTTSTGFVEAYTDFWFLGAGVFFVLSLILSLQYRQMNDGDPFVAMLYVSGLGVGLHSLTHGSYYYFINMPVVVCSILFIRRYARRSRQHRRPRRNGPASVSPLGTR